MNEKEITEKIAKITWLSKLAMTFVETLEEMLEKQYLISESNQSINSDEDMLVLKKLSSGCISNLDIICLKINDLLLPITDYKDDDEISPNIQRQIEVCIEMASALLNAKNTGQEGVDIFVIEEENEH